MTVLFVVVFLGTLAYRLARMDILRRARVDVMEHKRAFARDERIAELERELGMRLDEEPA